MAIGIGRHCRDDGAVLIAQLNGDSGVARLVAVLATVARVIAVDASLNSVVGNVTEVDVLVDRILKLERVHARGIVRGSIRVLGLY